MSDTQEQRLVEEIDDPQVEDLVQQRVPFTETLTEGDLTDRDAEGEAEELTAGLPQEMPSAAPGVESASNIPAPFYYSEETEEPHPLPPRQTRARRDFPPPPSQSPSTSNSEHPSPEPRRQRTRQRRSIRSPAGATPAPKTPAAAAASNPSGVRRAPTQAEREDHRLAAIQLEAELESRWHSKAATGAARREIERLRRVAAGGYVNIAQPTPTPAVEGETDEVGYRPGEKKAFIEKTRGRREKTDDYGYVVGSETDRSAEEGGEREERQPPRKRQRRSRGSKKGGDGKRSGGSEK
ncbi:MAG: hypothetical protein Q9181_005421 [Wetmoreana brouardii]